MSHFEGDKNTKETVCFKHFRDTPTPEYFSAKYFVFESSKKGLCKLIAFKGG